MIGYALCGSFCTFSKSVQVLSTLRKRGFDILPIMSEIAANTDTRFGRAADFVWQIEDICGHSVVRTVPDAEPLGPRTPLDVMIVAPCTGNTLAKFSHGVTDTAATMAMKAHLRSDRPMLIALASNDAMSQNLGSIARLVNRKAVYFVPMRQDDPRGKPHSLVADFEKIPECLALALRGEQMRPLFV